MSSALTHVLWFWESCIGKERRENHATIQCETDPAGTQGEVELVD